MKTLTVKQLGAALAKHAKFLNGTEGGERAEFVGVDLRDHAETLRGANLYGANLYGANLDGANLYGANLYGANLYGANLVRANLDGANLVRANLYGANLYGANLVRANLDGANLDGANLGSKTELGRKLRLVGACMEAVAWVDEQSHQDADKLFTECPRGDWKAWVERALGGSFSLQRLDIVVEYVTKGAA